jgi:hypothetical protein
MLRGEGIELGSAARYAAFGFWKTEFKMSTERVKKNPQSYGYEMLRDRILEVR